MSYCAVIRTEGGAIQKVVKADGTESQLFNKIAKHPLVKSKEEALSVFKNVFSNVIENQAEKTQDFFSSVVRGVSGKYIPATKYEHTLQYDEPQTAFKEAYESRTGNFDDHIATSIPTFRDVQIKKGNAIIAMGAKSVIDLGGSEGTFVKTISELSEGEITTTNVEPNKDMAAAHRTAPVDGSDVQEKAFLQGFGTVEAYHPAEKADVVHESMLFQFLTPERTAFVEEVVDKYVKEDGVFITEEKFQTQDKATYQANEEYKNKYHKGKYFTEAQVALKGEEVLVGMKKNQAQYDDYIAVLKNKFTYVSEYWSSGNFKGVIASNDKTKIDTFLKELGDVNSEFSENKTMEAVAIRALPIKKSLINLDRPKISVIFADNSTLVDSDNPLVNEQIQEELKEEVEEFQDLINCIWQ